MRRTATTLSVGCLLAVALLTSCGDGSSSDLAPAAEGGYAGPLYVSSEGLEKGDPHREMGAAADVVDCTTTETGGFNDPAAGPYDNGAAAATAGGAIDNAISEWGFDGARTGFARAAEEDDRVLYTYEVDGVAKQALIVHDGPTISEEGWYLESWARCDWSEFPESVTDDSSYLIWQDADGNNVATTELESFRGPEHCDWQDLSFVKLDGAEYVGGATGETVDYLVEDPESGVAVPANAADTGYSRDGGHLWVSADQQRAYFGSEQSADTWPRAREFFGCA